jgi:serine/threonine-protein kinase
MSDSLPTLPKPFAHEPMGDSRLSGTPSLERAKVVLVAGSDLQSAGGIETLLRRRLGTISLLLLGVHSGALLIFLPNLTSNNAWFVIAFNAIQWGAEAAYVALLWGARPLSLRKLRSLEVILFSMLMAGYAGYICSPVRLGSLLKYAQSKVDGSLSALSAAVAFPGFALLVIYGTFIPNTTRRCTIVVGGMVLFPLAVATISALKIPEVESSVLLHFLIQMALLLAFGAAIAIHGSHRIETLRQEALAARQFGQYQLRRLLGAGGMGQVYLAEHVLLRRPCALKIIRPKLMDNPEARTRFEREVQAMAALTHPNTVEIFDYGHADDGTFYYVMEYLPGLTLQELVDQYGPLPPERAVYLLRQVCAALEEAHGVGVIHRDIKPSNILICERGGIHDVAKLLDFGVVRAIDPGHDEKLFGRPFEEPNRPAPSDPSPGDTTPSEGSALFHPGLPIVPLTWERMPSGTPLYMSPEQACDRRDPDPRSDLYSLGATAYFLLTGQPPFAGETSARALDALLAHPVRPLTDLRPDIPDDLQQVVLRCLEKELSRRYPDVMSLERALADCGCADQWTRDRAAQWWRQRTASQPVSSPS